MDWYGLVKRYYDTKRYTKENVAVFVEADKITPDQYQTITGDIYVEGSA